MSINLILIASLEGKIIFFLFKKSGKKNMS